MVEYQRQSGEHLVRILLKLAGRINAAVHYQDILEATAPILPDCEGVYLLLCENLDFDKANYMEIVAAANVSAALTQRVGQRFYKQDFPFLQLTRHDRLVVVENIDTDERIDDISRAQYEELGSRAFLRVPFISEGRYIGSLFFKYAVSRQFSIQEREMTQGIADLVLAAVKRIHLLQQTTTAVEAQRKALRAEQEARDELAVLYKVSEAVQASQTFQDLVQAITPLVQQIEKINLILWEHLDYSRATYFEVTAGVTAQGLVNPIVGAHYSPDLYPISKVFENLSLLAIEDIYTHPLVDPVSRAGWENDNMRALLMVRLTHDGRWYGVLSFESTTPRQFTQREQRLTLAISELVLGAVIRIHTQQELATAIEAQQNALLAEQAARQEMAQLYQVSKAINQVSDMSQVLTAIKQLFPDPIHVDIFTWEHHDRSNATYLEATASTDPELPAGTRFPIERVRTLTNLGKTRVVAINNTNTPPWSTDPALDAVREFGLSAIAMTNLTHGNRFQGLIAIASYEPYTFSPEELRLMQATADLTSAAMERQRAYRAEQLALQEREVLFLASRSINSASNFQEILEAVKHIDFDGGHHYLYIFEGYDSRSASYIETVATSTDRIMVQGSRISLDDLPFLKTNPNPGLAVYDNIEDSPLLDEVTRSTLLSQGTRANLRFGLMWRGRILGAFGVDHDAPRKYTESDIRMMVALGELISAAVERIRLQEDMLEARERAERLAEQAQQLAALQERTRLARELHDSVSQALYGIGLGAQTAQRHLINNPHPARASVDYILSLAEAGLSEMRALIFEMRPESLETEGLMVALTKQAASIQARHQVKVHLELGKEPPLALGAKESLYRVLREALHNIIKHAVAQHITVRMHQSDDELIFEIIDDGIGFDTGKEFPGHLGLKSMQERVAQLGGKLQIKSAPGHGTHIIAQLPGCESIPPKPRAV